MNNFNLTLKKAYKNYLRLEGYGEITKQMVNDYYQMKKEYNNISKEYIQKLMLLNTNYTKTISHYKSTLEFSGNELQYLLILLEMINSIILSQAKKLQLFIDYCKVDEDKNQINQEKLNTFEKITNEFLLKEKKISKSYSELEICYKSLYNSYQIIENSLAENILLKGNKKISLNELFLNQEYKNIIDKEKIVLKAKEEITTQKNDFFKTYDNLMKIGRDISIDHIFMLKSNISCFISLYSNYCKSFSDELDKIIKIMATSEKKNNYINIIDSLIKNITKDININGYKIKIINNKAIEDKNKKLNLDKLDKIGYIIKNNKIMLKDEDIYEIVKIMYGQFQFIDEKQYNLTEEQIKINVKNLTKKLLSFDTKLKGSKNERIEPISENEINLLYKYLDKSFYRLEFLKVLNLHRTKSYEIPEREYEILKKIFLIIADKVQNEKDIACARLLLILSQTFYCKINDKDVYIQHYLKEHELFLNMEIWEKYLNESIEEEINRSERIEKKDNVKNEQKTKYKIKNILSSQLIPFCDNMLDFGMSAENIYKIIEPVMDKYEIKDDLKNVIDDLIKSRQSDSNK